MALTGVLDLSVVTERLTTLLQRAVDNSPLWSANHPKINFRVSDDPPDVIRDKDQICQLSLYLFHVAADKYQRNAPVTGPSVPPVPAQPLSLELFYLLTASSRVASTEEQQIMSIALESFHENAIIRAVTAADQPREEFTLTMEVESIDTLGRLWQGVTKPLRLGAIYRVGVVFLQPPSAPPSLAPPPERWVVTVDPATLPLAETGPVVGTFAAVNFVGPDGRPQSFSTAPAAVAAGQRFTLLGAGLGVAGISDNVYVLPAVGPEQDVIAWVKGIESTRVTLTVPAAAPPPGVYQLRVGNAAAARLCFTSVKRTPDFVRRWFGGI